MQLEISRKAQIDLIAIQDFGFANYGVVNTRKCLDGLRLIFKTIARWPEMARLRDEYGGTVRMHPHRSHLIFYRIEGDTLKVLRVVSQHQNWPNHL